MKRFANIQMVELDKIKGSRFIVTVSPISTENHFKDICPVYKRHIQMHKSSLLGMEIGRRSRERSSDDGEPSGSAGEPILQRMRRAELIDSMIVVTLGTLVVPNWEWVVWFGRMVVLPGKLIAQVQLEQS